VAIQRFLLTQLAAVYRCRIGMVLVSSSLRCAATQKGVVQRVELGKERGFHRRIGRLRGQMRGQPLQEFGAALNWHGLRGSVDEAHLSVGESERRHL
jgi:hypothetical protein